MPSYTGRRLENIVLTMIFTNYLICVLEIAVSSPKYILLCTHENTTRGGLGGEV